ncbi:transcriptional regulator [Thalassospira profundimaris]|uniref:Transcriptional regulator n=1 Tax=Thalassospira profundimaris TaxID=502049 RepID=A0A367WX61_9PROT|nr:type IV toxin-antitoxin system AbiEi family antitoxin domain-containing protein [Thalassospira profundimaris]RCK45300.1 transcriptional regulator [Thalassospira profundimaris]
MAATTEISQKERAVELLKERGAMRRIELSDAGVHPETLSRLVDEGVLTRVSRGLYQLTDADITAPHDLAEVAKRVPKGVICLISALQFHDLTLQTPSRVWVAIGPKARKPKIEYPPTRIVRFGEQALSLGVQTHTVDGVSVPIFDPAKTVVDCFRFRKLVGFDVALEGLHNVIKSGKAKPAEIIRYARDTRIWSVLRPYLETVVADGA